MTDETEIATLTPTPMRRVFSYGVLFLVGAMMIVTAFVQPPAFGLQLLLILLGAGTLILAEMLRRATTLGLILTADDLRDTSGVVVAQLSDIETIDRGILAFKPSNGFVLHLRTPAQRAWAPGLYWRFGTRVGVGGATATGPAKFMAEQIALRLSK